MPRAQIITLLAAALLAFWSPAAFSADQVSAQTELKQGFGAHRLGDKTTALKHYTLAIEHGRQLTVPMRIEAYRLRAELHKDLAKYAEAVADFDQAIKLGQGVMEKVQMAQLFGGRGSVYLNWRKKKAALEDFNRAQKLAPGLSRVYYHRGNAYHALRQYDLALADLNRAIRLERLHQYFWARSKIHMSLKDLKAAIADMEQAICLKPGRKLYLRRLKYLRLLQSQREGQIAGALGQSLPIGQANTF